MNKNKQEKTSLDIMTLILPEIITKPPDQCVQSLPRHQFQRKSVKLQDFDINALFTTFSPIFLVSSLRKRGVEQESPVVNQ